MIQCHGCPWNVKSRNAALHTGAQVWCLHHEAIVETQRCRQYLDFQFWCVVLSYGIIHRLSMVRIFSDGPFECLQREQVTSANVDHRPRWSVPLT